MIDSKTRLKMTLSDCIETTLIKHLPRMTVAAFTWVNTAVWLTTRLAHFLGSRFPEIKVWLPNIIFRDFDIKNICSLPSLKNVLNINWHSRALINTLTFVDKQDHTKPDCLLSSWSKYSNCRVTTGTCGIGYKAKHRNILVRLLFSYDKYSILIVLILNL